MFEFDRSKMSGYSDTQFFANPIEIIGMHGVEPHRRAVPATLILVTEQFQAPPRVVDGVGRQIPIPQPVVGGCFPQAVALFARPHRFDQALLFESGRQECGPLVMRLAPVVRQRVDFAGDGEQPEVEPARLDGYDDRDLVLVGLANAMRLAGGNCSIVQLVPTSSAASRWDRAPPRSAGGPPRDRRPTTQGTHLEPSLPTATADVADRRARGRAIAC